jgi:hypothetical protein
MWVVMMVAMMVPAASPVILLFTEINRRRNEHQATFVSTGQFLLGYLTAWTGFSVLATLCPVGPAYGGVGFTDDGEHEQSIGRGDCYLAQVSSSSAV